mmetsp:Transcript_19447/g.21749  ORF Transcript_19447/g.21749 Transcript_19447/m.21749 type:complete len:160 (+) Transcript_19447:337-816(+)
MGLALVVESPLCLGQCSSLRLRYSLHLLQFLGLYVQSPPCLCKLRLHVLDALVGHLADVLIDWQSRSTKVHQDQGQQTGPRSVHVNSGALSSELSDLCEPVHGRQSAGPLACDYKPSGRWRGHGKAGPSRFCLRAGRIRSGSCCCVKGTPKVLVSAASH